MKRKSKYNLPVSFALVVCLLLGGCSAAGEDLSSAEKSVYYAENSATSESATAYNGNSYATEAYEVSDVSFTSDVSMPGNTAVTDVTVARNKKIIYESNVVMETMVYSETYSRLLELIEKNNGYIEYENYDNELRSYLKDNSGKGKLVISKNSLIIRIPSINYSSFMTDGLSLGNVLRRNQTITDKTNEYNTNLSYVDILNEEASYLDKQLDQLSEELKNASASFYHYDDIIYSMKDIASRKAQVEKELVPYQRTIDDIDEKVEYSTISMELREVNEYTIIEEEIEEESFGSQIKKTWNNAINGLANMFKSIFLFIIEAIPTLVGIILIGIIAIIVLIPIRKKIKKVKASKASDYQKIKKEKESKAFDYQNNAEKQEESNLYTYRNENFDNDAQKNESVPGKASEENNEAAKGNVNAETNKPEKNPDKSKK